MCHILWKLYHHSNLVSQNEGYYNSSVTNCSLDFWVPVPLRVPLHYAPETFKIWSYGLTLLKYDNLTITQILREIKFWRIQMVKKCQFWQFYWFWILIFSKFEHLLSPKFTKIQCSEPLKLPKMTFLDRLNSPKFDFT